MKKLWKVLIPAVESKFLPVVEIKKFFKMLKPAVESKKVAEKSSNQRLKAKKGKTLNPVVKRKNVLLEKLFSSG